MAKYLRPRRGSKANAVAQKILLKKGEMFMEFPNSEIGKGPGRIIMGDGATSYQNMDYGTTATNVFRPFITDPEIFIPHFANTNPSTASWTVNSGTAAIAKMGDGSAASTVTLPTIIGAVKETLCKHADSITKLNNDLLHHIDFSGRRAIFEDSSEVATDDSYTTIFTEYGYVQAHVSIGASAGNPFMRITAYTYDGITGQVIYEYQTKKNDVYIYAWSPLIPVKPGTKIAFTLSTRSVSGGGQPAGTMREVLFYPIIQ